MNQPDTYYRNGPTKPVPGTTAHQSITLQEPQHMSDGDIAIAYKWIFDSENGKLPKGTAPFQWVGGDYPDTEPTPPSPVAKKPTQRTKRAATTSSKNTSSKSRAQGTKARRNAQASSSIHQDQDEFETIDLSSVSASNPKDTDTDEDAPPKRPVCFILSVSMGCILIYLTSYQKPRPRPRPTMFSAVEKGKTKASDNVQV